MEITAKELATLLNGSLEGNSEAKVSKLSKIEEGEPASVSFLENPQYNDFLYTTDASVVIVKDDLVLEKPVKESCTLIRVENPRRAFAALLEAYQKTKQKPAGVSPKAIVAETATIGEGVYIAPFVSIGENCTIGKGTYIHENTVIGDNVSLGENCLIHPNATIQYDCVIGNNCTVYSGAIIGSDGFGFTPNSENNYQKVAHTGNVVLEDYVEIGANTTIDRATLGSTILRKGVKLDNLIQIAHNVEVGENTVIAAQTGVAGSTTIGKNCMIGGQVGIVGHITIADEVKIAAQSGIGHSIKKKGEIVQGSPAFPIGDYKRSYVIFRSLPKINSKLDALENKVNNLK